MPVYDSLKRNPHILYLKDAVADPDDLGYSDTRVEAAGFRDEDRAPAIFHRFIRTLFLNSDETLSDSDFPLAIAMAKDSLNLTTNSKLLQEHHEGLEKAFTIGLYGSSFYSLLKAIKSLVGENIQYNSILDEFIKGHLHPGKREDQVKLFKLFEKPFFETNNTFNLLITAIRFRLSNATYIDQDIKNYLATSSFKAISAEHSATYTSTSAAASSVDDMNKAALRVVEKATGLSWRTLRLYISESTPSLVLNQRFDGSIFELTNLLQKRLGLQDLQVTCNYDNQYYISSPSLGDIASLENNPLFKMKAAAVLAVKHYSGQSLSKGDNEVSEAENGPPAPGFFTAWAHGEQGKDQASIFLQKLDNIDSDKEAMKFIEGYLKKAKGGMNKHSFKTYLINELEKIFNPTTRWITKPKIHDIDRVVTYMNDAVVPTSPSAVRH